MYLENRQEGSDVSEKEIEQIFQNKSKSQCHKSGMEVSVLYVVCQTHR